MTNFALYTNVDKFISWIQDPTEELTATPATVKIKQSTTRAQTQTHSALHTQAKTTPRTHTQPSYTIPTYQKPAFEFFQTTLKPIVTCGVMSSSRGLIQGGSQSSRDQFPWTVAISVRQKFGNYQYFSTGTLISDKHIITTGLSLAYLDQASQKYIARNPLDFNMYFGIKDLDLPFEIGTSFLSGADQVHLHPSIQHGYPRIANVGILSIKYPREFGKYISPACIPENDFDFESADTRAYAVGWGQDDTGADSKTKKYAAVKIRSQSGCESYWSEYLQRGGSSKFFCAGGDGFNSACYRDQPLYVKQDAKWILRGLISIAMNLPDNTCDLNKPVLYEDVGQYRGWIKTILN